MQVSIWLQAAFNTQLSLLLCQKLLKFCVLQNLIITSLLVTLLCANNCPARPGIAVVV